ncbi:MAG: hypothetical protein HYX52_06355 [Chloroflexi bacterium]|nr:hypothetical protein [Chloroflexota bacterium]
MKTLQPPSEVSADTVASARPRPFVLPRVGVEAESRAARRAWLTLWVAFGTLCVLLGVAVQVAYQYVTHSDVDRTARADNIRGEVYAQIADGPQVRLSTADRSLPVGAVVESTRGASGRIQLFESSSATVLSEGRLQLVRMDVGRFINRSTVILRQDQGSVRYEPASDIVVELAGGRATVRKGDSTIWIQPDGTARVLVYDGEVSLEGASALPVTVRAGQRADLRPDRQISSPVARAMSLFDNGDFARQADGWETIDVQNGPPDTDGERYFVPGPTVDGQPLSALRILRNSIALSHGETGLRRPLDVDVSGFRSLYVEALIRVDSASLSGGGQVGSEYPMMLRVQYEGVREGTRPDWLVGFFYANPENRPVRNAVEVPQGEWVTYRVNLMDQNEERKPFRVLSFEVMGQGHSYDARVAAVRLVGD